MLSLQYFFVALTSPLIHPFHVSVAEMEFNAETKCLEVALRVWPEDLEKALNRKSKQAIDLDKHPKIDQLIFAYVKEHIEISKPQSQKPCKMTWIGKEIELKHAWLYFEVETEVEPVDFVFSNRLFFELQDDQVNLFNLSFKTKRASISFVKDKAIHQLSPKDFVPVRNPFSRPPSNSARQEIGK